MLKPSLKQSPLSKNTPLRSSTRSVRRFQLTDDSQSAQVDKSDFMCLPRSHLHSVRQSAKLTQSTIVAYDEDESTLEKWGFQCPRKKDRVHVPTSSKKKKLEEKPVVKVSQPVNWQYISYIVAFTGLMLASAVLGAFCYAYIQHHVVQDTECTLPPKSYSTDVMTQDGRPTQLELHVQELASTVLHLTEQLNSLQGKVFKSPNIVSELIPQPSKGVLEELFPVEPDLACAGNLGSVLATPDTATHTEVVDLSVLGLLSFQVHLPHRPPHTTIQGLIQEIGDCWAFSSQQGRLVLALHRPSLLTSVSISHMPRTLSPTGDINSAPRHFQVLAHLEEDLEHGLALGEFEYNKAGPWRQTFILDSLNAEDSSLFSIVEFRFLSNYGNPNYTCVYRVHIHGSMAFT